MEEVARTIHNILEDKLGIVSTQVTSDANFVKDLGVDSLDYAELVMEFEQKFKIKIPDQDAEKLLTVQDAVDYIENKIDTSS